MTVPAPTQIPVGNESVPARILRAAALTALSDGLFSSVLSAVFYGSTVTRLWQGVAATLLGPSALDGGMRTVAIGLVMHLGVATWWSTLFVLVVLRWSRVRAALGTSRGVVAVAAVYGPLVWLAMSFVVIPLLVHRPTSITYRWWVQFFGHIPFVGLPLVWSVARDLRGAGSIATLVAAKEPA